jgi:pyruvate dehydrogenase (quinone)
MADRTVSDVLVERLSQWGVDRVFGYSGDGINEEGLAARRAERHLRRERADEGYEDPS